MCFSDRKHFRTQLRYNLHKFETAIEGTTNHFCKLHVQVKERAVQLAKDMENEDGVMGAVRAFFKHLPYKKPEPDPELEPEPVPGPTPINFFSLIRCFCCS